MKRYEEELKEKKMQFKKELNSLRMGFGVLNAILPIVHPDQISGPYINPNGSTIYLRSVDPEEAELVIIPTISDTFTISSRKWNKLPTDDGFIYMTSIYIQNKLVVIHLTLNLSASCKIEKVATGEMITVDKYVTVTEPEYETVISCGGNGS